MDNDFRSHFKINLKINCKRETKMTKATKTILDAKTKFNALANAKHIFA